MVSTLAEIATKYAINTDIAQDLADRYLRSTMKITSECYGDGIDVTFSLNRFAGTQLVAKVKTTIEDVDSLPVDTWKSFREVLQNDADNSFRLCEVGQSYCTLEASGDSMLTIIHSIRKKGRPAVSTKIKIEKERGLELIDTIIEAILQKDKMKDSDS